MINKNQRILGLVLLLLSLFIIISSVNAAALNPSDDIKEKVESAPSESTIELNPNNEFKLNSRIYLEDKTITIKSSSTSKNAVINLYRRDYAFAISATGKLNLKNITIKSGDGAYAGGIHNNGGMITLNGCTFTENKGQDSGAIYNGYGSLTANDCAFTMNKGSDGGAIYNDGGKLTLSKCTFTGNKATKAGAIYNHESTTATLTGCTFRM